MTALQASSQAWKLHATTATLLVSLGIMVSAVFSGLYLFFVGLALGTVGMVLCNLAIRCPQCGAHWYWRLFKAHGYGTKIGWARELIRQTECPSCSYNRHDGA